MPTTRYLTTYSDCVDHLMDFIGSDAADSSVRRECRRAAQMALDEVANLHRWSYYVQIGRVVTSASYDTGTIEYDHTGGANERQLTLTTGTWPSWAANGVVIISGVPYDVYSRVSDSIVTLAATSNPGADVASGTSYSIHRDSYPLPTNFACVLSPVLDVSSKIHLSYVKPSDWFSQQTWQPTPGVPWSYTITGDPNYQDISTMRLNPPPSSQTRYGFVYKRHPRRLAIDEHREKTITASSTTITGATGSAFTSQMVGCVIRPSTTSEDVTGLAGNNPFVEERIITGYTDANTLTIDTAFSGTYTNKKYVISDPLDVESKVMRNLYLRTAELKLATIRRPNDRGAVYAAWQNELQLAVSADNRNMESRSVHTGIGLNLTDYVLTFSNLDMGS